MPTEEELLRELDPDIRALAKRWSRDDPDSWEDLDQEARLAIAQELREKPDSPRTHLFRRAKHEILDYRKRGKSVDGKRDKTYRRKFVWDLASLDADPALIYADGSSPYFRPRHQRPVEDLAVANLTYDQLRSQLSEVENEYLSLRLQGYSGREASVLLGLTRYQERNVRESLQGKARPLFSADGYRPCPASPR